MGPLQHPLRWNVHFVQKSQKNTLVLLKNEMFLGYTGLPTLKNALLL